MKFLNALALFALADLVSGSPHHLQQDRRPSQLYSQGKRGSSTAKAVYFQTNDARQNKIVALSVGRDGSLVGARGFSTGGRGSSGVAGNTTVHSDALFSQDAIRVGDDFLFAVNAGSNTLSMFNINPRDGSLRMVGRPVNTLAEFPVAVAYSSRLKQACVLNGGAKDGVSCFRADPRRGLQSCDSVVRPLNMGQSTPPKGPTGTASDIFFNQDSSALLVTVKGDPMVNNTGFVAVYPIENNQVSQKAVMSSPDWSAVLFGSAINPTSDTFLATDASFGMVVARMNPGDFSVQTLQKTEIDGQGATCWAAYSRRTDSFFVTDVMMNRIVEADAKGSIVGTYELSNGNPGMIDNIVGGNFLYNLSPLNESVAVAVMDLSGGQGKAREMQTYIVRGAGISSMGMAVYPSSQ